MNWRKAEAPNSPSAASPEVAALTSHSSGATLSGASVTFTWSAAAGAQYYYLKVGSRGAGTDNLFDANVGTGLSRTLSLPADGRTIYFRLYTYNAGWHYNDCVFTAATAPWDGLSVRAVAATFVNRGGVPECPRFD